jgi:osmotically inducible protein OsmC
MATRDGSATWEGDLENGSGRLVVGEGAWEGDYSAQSRFEEGSGTNPEELLAAAHAACFSMALSNDLAQHGHQPRSVRTRARVQLRNVDGAPTIASIELETEGDVEGIDADHFAEHAEDAKRNCPVSRALAAVAEISVSPSLSQDG